ncbi:MAG TPA: hypothetical protein VG309_03500 [Rhizomicrobium sp.]|nr:hypothetical protein [Rhizomicrobium sp.]
MDWRDEPVFAELAILRIFKSENWDGRWIDSYGRKYRVGYWKDDTVVPLPEAQDKYLDRIRNAAGQKGGCFDVFCWRDGDVVFAEAKRKGKDRIRGSQRRWVEAALHLGVAADQLLIVEWIIA